MSSAACTCGTDPFGNHDPNCPRLGPAPLPECDYCGNAFLDPKRGYKHGCPKHDPYLRRRENLDALASDYGVVRAILRASRATNVEIALVALDRIHALAKETIR